MNNIIVTMLCLLFLSVSAHAFETQKIQHQTIKGKTISSQLDELSSERQSQDNLPVATGDIWDKLFKCKISFNNKNGDYSVKATEDIKAMVGKTVQIKGFMYPLSMAETQKEILLSKRTPVCFFCPPGEPNEVLYVQLAKPTDLKDDLVTIEGRFDMTDRKQEGIFFVLKDARLVN